MLYSDGETNIMKRRKRTISMSKPLDNKNARREIARFYSFDKQAHHKMSSFPSEFGVGYGSDQSKRGSVGNTSLKVIKKTFIPHHKQQRRSLQPVSFHHSYENDHSPLSQSNQGIRFICGLQTPPISITKPKTVQPDYRLFTQKQGLTRAFSESCATMLVNPNNDTIHVNSETSDDKKFSLSSNETKRCIRLPKLSEPNLDRHFHLWLSCSKFNTPIFHADKSATSSHESVWFEAKRRLSSTEVFDPLMRILSTVPLRNQTDVDTSWTNFTMNPDTNGHICFSLVYTCTLSTLNVTINRLIGVSNLIKSSNALPSQTSANFVVSLRLRHSRKPSVYKSEGEGEGRKADSEAESDGFHKKYFTQPVSTSLNPNLTSHLCFK
ncbi:unnamed protein product [Heterobilharzia americana]|nr:unnamed protein product [Heterobilharzia americana]